MRRAIRIALAALLALGAVEPAGFAGAQSAGAAPKGPKRTVTVVGELLDMGCYTSRALRGQIHRECALKCLANGVPMGLLTADSTVYVLTQNHDRAMDAKSYAGSPDPYVQARQWPALQVEVIGFDWERKGVKFLEVKFAKLAGAAGAGGSTSGTTSGTKP